MPVNKFTSFTTNINRRISCYEISKSKNIKKTAFVSLPLRLFEPPPLLGEDLILSSVFLRRTHVYFVTHFVAVTVPSA